MCERIAIFNHGGHKPAFRRLGEPLGRLHEIARHPVAVAIVESEVVPGARMALFGGSLLAGDHDGVLRVIAGWYQQSEERAEQIRNDPAILEMIK